MQTEDMYLSLLALTEVIRLRRKELGLTQLTAGARAGIGPAAWNHLETGRRWPNLKTLLLVMDVLDLEIVVKDKL